MSSDVNPDRIANRARLATLCDVSVITVDTWVKNGCPALVRGSKGREWSFDVAAVNKWRIKREVEAAVSGLQGEDGKITKDEADRRRAIANAITAEVEADEALKSVVARFDAESAMADFCQALRSGLSNTGSKIATRTATMTNPGEIRDFCQGEISRALRVADADLRERWAGELGEDGDDSGED